MVFKNWIYLISGYNSNLYKDRRYIPQCEKMDLITMNTYESREINYPRIWASSINYENKFFYTFGGYNPYY